MERIGHEAQRGVEGAGGGLIAEGSLSNAGLERMTDEELTVLYNEANGITGKRLPITTQRIFTAMRAAAEVERKAAELRCLKKPVLLAGLHPYTALKVQQMMSDAVSMRSNDQIQGAEPLAAKAPAGMPG